ncbi:hypothetical protein O181_030496 [Austropuccinia psidii MF-1]|uniref:Uncharacterized protein n=1 Tax=Austropuccinia psidii MF-1 TaxID=1389203 RepID=A0A9Q3H4B4_9BASI|nr:hypothetical protein [Austropuccinia psidii MF-1]
MPEAKSKICIRNHRKSREFNSPDSDFITSNSSLDQITLRETCSLRRDTPKIINESLPTTSTQQNYFPILTPHTQNPSSGSEEIPSFDVDYISTSTFLFQLNISALIDHQIKGEVLDHI